MQVLVLAEKTIECAQYFPSLQTFVVLELGFSITPVPGPTEAAGVLLQMVSCVCYLGTQTFARLHALPKGILASFSF